MKYFARSSARVARPVPNVAGYKDAFFYLKLDAEQSEFVRYL